MRHRAKLVIGLLFVSLLAVSLPACGHAKPDTTQLSSQGHKEYTADQVVKVVNDVTTTVVAASRAGKIKDADERLILTINKQVLDVIASNPTTWKELALSAITNARQALSPEQDAVVGGYLQVVVNVLKGV